MNCCLWVCEVTCFRCEVLRRMFCACAVYTRISIGRMVIEFLL